MREAPTSRRGWIERLLEGGEPIAFEVAVQCDGLGEVEAAMGPEAADHLRKIMLRLVHEAAPEGSEIRMVEDRISFDAAGGFDADLWTIRVEELYKRAVYDAGYEIAIVFDHEEHMPVPAFLS